MTEQPNRKRVFNFEDIMQVVVGASALSVPVAFSEESWNLSKTLPGWNIVLLVSLSLLFVNLYSIQNIFQGQVSSRFRSFIGRTVLVYLLTCVVVAIVLLALNRLPILSETIVSLKRIIILAFPASMGAVVVDSFDKE